ncbi:MAG: hypothetical protein IPP71_08940 [Bacteroidetes bacterium]|nr:hypothetical protein [Bacteroidota bacterium]
MKKVLSLWHFGLKAAHLQIFRVMNHKLSGGFSLEGITVTESADALINMNTITSQLMYPFMF